MKAIAVETTESTQLVDVTEKVQDLARSEGVEVGLCYIFVPHTTAGITLNENADPNVRKDLLNALNHIVPEGWHYSHVEGNSPAHIKASLVGHSAVVAIENGRLVLGSWQGIFLCEFDGPRRRYLFVRFLKG
jgi:secondary thiamine-phosphate synthase enzyme